MDWTTDAAGDVNFEVDMGNVQASVVHAYLGFISVFWATLSLVSVSVGGELGEAIARSWIMAVAMTTMPMSNGKVLSKQRWYVRLGLTSLSGVFGVVSCLVQYTCLDLPHRTQDDQLGYGWVFVSLLVLAVVCAFAWLLANRLVSREFGVTS